MRKRLLAAFLSLVLVIGLLPATALATGGEPVELDISNGSIIITENGYSQGTLVYDEISGYLVQGEDKETVTETTWDDSNENHALTITGESTSATILIMGGSPIVTLNNLTINQSEIRVPGLVLVSGSSSSSQNTATIVLGGENTLSSKDQVPGVQINKDATLTIKGSGSLTASSTNHTAGIGVARVTSYSINPSTKLIDQNYRTGGHLIIESGTINATGHSNSGSIGGSYNLAFGSIQVKGGEITTAGSNDSLRASNITISGGTLLGLHNPISATTTLNITGGNIGDSYSGDITDRTRTQLFFYDAEQNAPRTNAEVTVTENDHTWSALTDANGVITTYLAEGTTSISAVVGETTYPGITITDGKGVVGATCTCTENPGTLTMITEPQGLTVTNGTATLELEAVYAKGSGCVLPDGFHGDYEDISYEITKVVKNGQYQTVGQYASINEDTNVLSVYDETNADSYTVYVRAKCGPTGGEVYSEEIAISVGTYVAETPSAGENSFDIGLGDIVITAGTDDNAGKTVYTQGTKTVTVDANTEVTITGSSITAGANSTANMITVKGGNPVMVLDDVTVTKTSADGKEPVILLYGGTGNGADLAADATIILKGTNTLAAGSAPTIQINTNAILTIKGDGSLSASTSGTNYAAIGASNDAAYSYAYTDAAGKTATNRNYGAGGQLVVGSGTIFARGNGRGTSGIVAGIGQSYYNQFGGVTVKGGVVQATNTNPDGRSITANQITIEGGLVETQGTEGIYANSAFSMSGGTLTGSGALDCGESATVSITGGNVNGYYADEITDRTLTKLYFVDKDGTPKANTEVTVTESNDPDANTWSAYTDENGVVTTYFASTTEKIEADVGSTANTEVDLTNNQALIGGTCSCTKFDDIDWNPGLPETVTLYQDEQTITVADAELVTTTSCNMPIHPSLPAITYSLAVKDSSGTDVVSESVSTYAELSGNTLTLKKQNAPYTVTLTATAGQESADCTVSVLAGTTNPDQTVIDLSKGDVTISSGEDDSYTYTQGGTSNSARANILLTGNAANAVVTVNAGNINLGIAQDVTGNVWTILAGEDVTGISIDIETLAGKVRFGNEGDQQYLMGYVSGEKVKLNPDAENITLGDGSAAQGKFTVKGLGSRSAVIGGADTEADRLVTNSGTDALSVEINGETVSLTAGGSHTIEKANKSSIKADGTVASYLLNGTTLLNEFSLEDPKYSYMTAEKFRELIGNAEVVGTVTGYRLAVVGEGSTAGLHGYRENGTLDQQKIAELYLDADLTEIISDTTAAYENDFLFYTNIRSLSLDHAKSVGLYSCFFESIHLGPQVESFASSNYLRGLQEITVDEENEYYKTVDGVLYTKDGSTLILCPTGKTGNYKILDTCTAIADVSFYGSHLSELTFGNQLSSLGSRWMENARFTAVHVPTSNPYFKSEDGVLYSLDGATLLYYPVYKTDSEFSIPKGVTTISNMAIYNQYRLKKLTLPSTLSSVGAYVFRGSPLEELDIKTTTLASASINSAVLSKVTVPDGYNFQNKLLTSTPMAWTQGITVSGGGNISYDGESHSISVLCQNGANVDIQYSLDGEEWSDSVRCVEPGEYTVYWKATKPADETCSFARELYSSRTFTITELEADESWFTLTAVKPDNPDEEFTPVKLDQPDAAPSLEDGYTVTYSKDGTGTPTEAVPTETGNYLVKVNITANGYAKETLTLGYYTILSDEQSGSNVLSFVTNGGTTITPIIATADTSISQPANPTKLGYTFAGWYSDAALRTKVETFPTTMPSESVTYYAKWTRENYTIEYLLSKAGATHNNPTTYHVETPTFTLSDPVAAGYTFKGWLIEGETVRPVTIEKGTTGDKSYTAVWEIIEYKITYPNSYDQVEVNPTSYTVDDTSGKAISLTAPEAREGYTFSGWTMVVDGTSYILPAENAAIPAGTLGDITLTGIWLAQDQKITLNANGGKFEGGSETLTITAEYGSSVTLTTPTRSGYTFAGWYTDEDCTTPFTGTTMPLTTTLYAGWTAIPTDDDNGGSTGGSDSNPSYSPILDVSDGGTIKVSPRTPEEDEEVTITVDPDAGYELDELTVADRNGREIDVTANRDGTYTFIQPRGRVTIEANFVRTGESGFYFIDVPESAYYYDAVYWAVDEGITNGTTATTFSPNNACTRAQMVTFLWRAAGEPEPETTVNPFTDVAAGAYYYDAVLWAVEQGITNGTTATTFSPNATVTRAQTVTFLWRSAGSPAATGSGFADVASDAYYAGAVAWAVSEGITNGTTATTFSPSSSCTRAQIVTFLYRYMA